MPEHKEVRVLADEAFDQPATPFTLFAALPLVETHTVVGRKNEGRESQTNQSAAV
jgi:hypothetical protein